MHKEMKQLLKMLEEQGFSTKRTKKGHTSVWKDGTYVTTLPGTPSDRRGFNNAVGQARRHGFIYKEH